MEKHSKDDWRIDALKTIKDDKWEKSKFKTIEESHWEHEHCTLCWRTISEDPSIGEEFGYVNKHDQWLCETCYKDFFEKDSGDTQANPG